MRTVLSSVALVLLVSSLCGCPSQPEAVAKPKWTSQLAKQLGAVAGGSCAEHEATMCDGPNAQFVVRMLTDDRFHSLTLSTRQVDPLSAAATIERGLRGVVPDELMRGLSARLTPNAGAQDHFEYRRIGVDSEMKWEEPTIVDEMHPRMIRASVTISWPLSPDEIKLVH